jgi:hypothetical protein
LLVGTTNSTTLLAFPTSSTGSQKEAQEQVEEPEAAPSNVQTRLNFKFANGTNFTSTQNVTEEGAAAIKAILVGEIEKQLASPEEALDEEEVEEGSGDDSGSGNNGNDDNP